MVCLDEHGDGGPPALLWNDTRSADAAAELVDELGGPAQGGQAWAEAVGSVPVGVVHRDQAALARRARTGECRRGPRRCAFPMTGSPGSSGWPGGRRLGANALATDRGDASGTGYFSPTTGEYRLDLLERAFGRVVELPRILAPAQPAGHTPDGLSSGAGPGTTPPRRSVSRLPG